MDQPIKMQHVHSASGKATQTELYTYEYDHAGRLLTTKHQLNGGAETLLASNSYDELGRLQSNQRNGQAKLKTDYTYNIRSWVKTISNPLFNETLYYQDAPSASLVGYEPNYNGNISAMSWKTNDNKDRTYVFNYDNLSRLTSAAYSQMGNPLANYNESSSYDPHGNVTAIQRFGRTGTGTFGLIDNLTMNYNGNQLVKAEDAVSTSNFSDQGDFRNGVSKAVEYEYDKNGNMTKDFNKGISSISYNSLNLPVSLSIANDLGSATNNYTYSADGKKLKVEMKFGNQIKTTDYVDNMIYENGALKRILIDDGYIENNKYHFFIQDHLGNNRAVAQADGTVIQTNHYYPYGMTFTEDNTGDPKAQPYKYGGKEFDGERGLNLYDFLARSVEPAEGRFTSIDPLCEKYYSISPYVYCANNPIKFVDPDGRKIVIGGLWDNLCSFFGVKTDYVKKVEQDLKQLKKDHPDVNKMIIKLEKSPNVHTIKMPEKESFNKVTYDKTKAINKVSQGSVISYDPSNNKTSIEEKRTPRVGLSHELQHSSDVDNGKYTNAKTENGVSVMEVDAINTENKVRKNTGDPKRVKYGNKTVSNIWLE